MLFLILLLTLLEIFLFNIISYGSLIMLFLSYYFFPFYHTLLLLSSILFVVSLHYHIHIGFCRFFFSLYPSLIFYYLLSYFFKPVVAYHIRQSFIYLKFIISKFRLHLSHLLLPLLGHHNILYESIAIDFLPYFIILSPYHPLLPYLIIL